MPYIYKEPEPIWVYGRSNGPRFQAYRIDDVQEMMEHRCKEQGHEYENCCSVTLQVYQECRWCGHRR